MKPENSNPDLSVVLAVYNEKAALAEEVEIIRGALEKSRWTFELIVVDDGSDDGTAAIAAEIPGITLLTHRENRGSGAARRTGTRAARGKVVVWTDVDRSYPNHLIPDLAEEMERQGFDQVVGARDSEKGSHRPFRIAAKFLIRRLAIFLSRTPIPDLNSGMRAFRRETALPYLALLPDGFSCTSTMTLSFLCNGRSVGYLPIPYAARVGRSKFGFFTDTYRYLLQVIRMVMYFDPLRVFLPLGGVLTLLGLLTSSRNVFRGKGIEQSDIIIFMAALMIVVIGLLADLIVTQSKIQDR